MKAACAALALLVCSAAAGAQVCDRDADACETPSGAYRVALPDTPEGAPSVMMLHGAGGTSRGMLGVSGTVKALTARGYAVIAPNGLQWRPGRDGGIWSFLPAVADLPRRDEGAFFAEVVADAAQRFGLDSEIVILSGFSAGAFMVTYLACERPGDFAAYAPIAGGFWRPHPESCAGPVRLFQTHGWRDSTVPLEGRPLGGGRWLQGDILEGLTIWRAANRCARPDPDRYETTGPFQRRRWDCADGSALEFALFPGGHSIPGGWADMMLDWFEALDD